MTINPLPPEPEDDPPRVFNRPIPRSADVTGEPVYPIGMPDLRQRQPEYEKLVEAVLRAVNRSEFPDITNKRDRIRLEVALWRFLYSAEWPK